MHHPFLFPLPLYESLAFGKPFYYSTSCPCPGPGSKGSSSWTAWSTAVQVPGGEEVTLVVFMGLSNFFSFCRQDCPCGYRSSIPQRPLCDGDSRIPCGQKQRSEHGVHAHCRRGTESWWVKGKGTRIGRRQRPWERMVSSIGLLEGVWGGLRQGGSLLVKLLPGKLWTQRWCLLVTPSCPPAVCCHLVPGSSCSLQGSFCLLQASHQFSL